MPSKISLQSVVADAERLAANADTSATADQMRRQALALSDRPKTKKETPKLRTYEDTLGGLVAENAVRIKENFMKLSLRANKIKPEEP